MGTTSKKTVTRSPSAPVRRTRRASEQTVSAGGPTTEQIAELAYRYFEEGGYVQGNELEHWLRAETELRSR